MIESGAGPKILMGQPQKFEWQKRVTSRAPDTHGRSVTENWGEGGRCKNHLSWESEAKQRIHVWTLGGRKFKYGHAYRKSLKDSHVMITLQIPTFLF